MKGFFRTIHGIQVIHCAVGTGGLILEMGGAMTGDNHQAGANRPVVPGLSGTYPGVFPKDQGLSE